MGTTIKAIAVAFLAVLLVACGGGGGDSTAPRNDVVAVDNPDTPPDDDYPPPPSFVVDTTAQFSSPGSITLDRNGNLYVMDRGNRAIRRISTTGDVTTIQSNVRPGKMVGDPSGNQFIVSFNPDDLFGTYGRQSYEVHRITPSGEKTLITRILEQPGSSHPLSLSTDARGGLYIYTTYRNQSFWVSRLDPSDNYTAWMGVFRGFMSFMPSPAGFASDAAGNLAFAFAYMPLLGAAVQVIPQSAQAFEGSINPETAQAVPGGTLGDMVLDQNGDIYTANAEVFADNTGSVTGYGAVRINKIAPDGTVTRIYSGYLDGSNSVRPSSSPYYDEVVGLTRAGNGDFYLSDKYSHAIYKVTPTGQVSLVAGKPGEAGNLD